MSVPIVTASDGRPSLVTRIPLNAPATMPTTSTVGMIAPIGQPWLQRYPTSALESPRIDATERSISPVITISVSGSVMIATSPTERQR